VFSRLYSYVADAAAGITAQPARFDADLNDMATGMTSCLLRDGTGTPTANIGWGGYRITGLADPVNPQDAATRNYVLTSTVGLYLPVAGGTLTGDLVISKASTSATIAMNPGTGGASQIFLAGLGNAAGLLILGIAGSAYYNSDAHYFRNYAQSVTYFNILSTGATLTVGLTGTSAAFTSITNNGLAVGYLDVPQNPQAAAYTLTLTDRSEHIYYTGAAAVLTIPTNATVAFPIGAATTIVNDGTGALSLTRAAGVTMKLVGTGANLDRSLAVAGIATLLKVGTNTWFLSGTGIT